ncbi:hypothetical protein Tco_0557207 [Tanacetum coccineum]
MEISRLSLLEPEDRCEQLHMAITADSITLKCPSAKDSALYKEAWWRCAVVVGDAARANGCVVRPEMHDMLHMLVDWNVDQEVMDMLPTSVKLVIGDVGDPAALRSVVEGCNKIIYFSTARSSITVDLKRVDHQGVYNLSKGFQDYNNKLAQLRAGKSSKSKLLLAKFKSAESLNGCEVRKGTFFQDEATAKYDGGMDAKFEFSEWRCSYVFTRGYVDLSTKLSLPLGSTLDRYKGLILSIGGNGRSYVLILESGPTVRVPLSSFRPVNPADPPLDPFLIHTFTISFEPRRQLKGGYFRTAFGAHEHSATGIFEVNDRFATWIFITNCLTLLSVPFLFRIGASSVKNTCNNENWRQKICSVFSNKYDQARERTKNEQRIIDHLIDINEVYRFRPPSSPSLS